MKSITVYCGSSLGNLPIFEEIAFSLGEYIAEQGMTLVYGGANVGTMAAVANGALKKNGKVIGVLPSILKEKELAHENLSEFISVNTFHERKKLLFDKGDAVITLPGGFGTMDEFFEVLTWCQLGMYSKPLAIFNVNGFYDHLIAQINVMIKYGFLHTEYQHLFMVNDNVKDIINDLKNFKPTQHVKWVTKNDI